MGNDFRLVAFPSKGGGDSAECARFGRRGAGLVWPIKKDHTLLVCEDLEEGRGLVFEWGENRASAQNFARTVDDL